MNKTKKRGGRVLFYDETDMRYKCTAGGLDAHNSDCVPNSLYLLGILTREMATRFAFDKTYVNKTTGTKTIDIIDWFDETFGEEHYQEVLYDSEDPTSYDNEKFMAYLNFLMPYPYMGMPVSYNTYNGIQIKILFQRSA